MQTGGINHLMPQCLKNNIERYCGKILENSKNF